MIHNFMELSLLAGCPGEALRCKKVSDIHRKIWLKPVKETGLGILVRALFDTYKMLLKLKMTVCLFFIVCFFNAL